MTPGGARRPTLAKVALLANVSTATASNVLAGKGRVSAETAARVNDAAIRLGYRTDVGARALSMGRTTTVGVIVPSEVDTLIRQRQSFFWLHLFDAFVSRSSELNVTVAIVNESQAQSLIDSAIDVLVLIGPHDEKLLASLTVPFGLPVVSSQSTDVASANFPQHNPHVVAELVVDEFSLLGRKVIAWMPGASSRLLADWSAALEEVADRRNMKVIEFDHDDSVESLSATCELTESASVDAIFGLFRNPKSLIDALKLAGRRIPQDVAVIVQSEGLLEEVTSPTLSNVSLCGMDCGGRLAEYAIRLAHGQPQSPVALPVELVRRQSTASR